GQDRGQRDRQHQGRHHQVLTAELPSPEGDPLTYFKGRYRHLG
ncbi:flavin reductase, partial [Streptomyces californicus]